MFLAVVTKRVTGFEYPSDRGIRTVQGILDLLLCIICGLPMVLARPQEAVDQGAMRLQRRPTASALHRRTPTTITRILFLPPFRRLPWAGQLDGCAEHSKPLPPIKSEKWSPQPFPSSGAESGGEGDHPTRQRPRNQQI
ncbi:hypothetical protein DM02DRAFT_634799 [Periconia macrospinosa]|uniref:Uncharacterized protein n=1 Tax=Periconia macrospinosa TaxID=97972 RepID=A0A2V1D535_9PLEO|nr:hypothetical protein DM02DRAFT_634799 [Periconia macrospinosa]